MNKIENTDDLISRFLSGEASPEEAMLLEDWKAESQPNRDYYEGCVKIFNASGKISHAPVVNTGAAWEKVRSQLRSGDNIRSINPGKMFLRIAASVILLAGLGSVIFYMLRNKELENIAYTSGQTAKKVELKDGTSVTMAANSSLTADAEYGKKNRTLHLKGSAYFSVVHDSKLPLLIDAGNIFIKDIGTKFNVTTSVDTDTVFVHVDEGIVLLFDGGGSEITIKANEGALYIKSKRELKVNLQTPNTIQFNFTNNKLSDVVANLSRAYNAHIIIENPAVENCTITTRFTNENLETILSVIAETLGLKVEKTPEGYLIKGEKCNR